MDKKSISDFSRRISQGNRSEIIVVLFDIFFAYTADARRGLEEDLDAAAEGVRRASMVAEHLKSDLDFSYSIAGELYPLYVFAQRALTRALYKKDPAELDEAEAIMRPLAEAFREVAKQDESGSVVQNGESIVAGYTYGRSDVNEAFADYDANRGFLA